MIGGRIAAHPCPCQKSGPLALPSTGFFMIRVLFVCLGNICRSPQAEGIFRYLVVEAGLQGDFDIDSAGTGGWHVGELPDPRTREASRRHNIELTMRARQFQAADLDEFDFILAMDANNFRDITALRPDRPVRADVSMLRSHDASAQSFDVPDPYYGGANGFENVFQICRRGCTGLLSKIISEKLNTAGSV